MHFYRSFKKEYKFFRKHNPTAHQAWFAALAGCSCTVAVLLCYGSLQNLYMKQKVEKDKQVGLLELRVKSHKTIVEDWAHWDVLYAYTQSGDQSFIDDNVMHTSIAIDGQALILGTGDKPLKNLKKSTIEPELSKCLQQHILSF